MRNAVFAAFYCNSPIYTNYHDPSMLDRDRNRNYRMVMMFHRWDNKIGFVGGFADDKIIGRS